MSTLTSPAVTAAAVTARLTADNECWHSLLLPPGWLLVDTVSVKANHWAPTFHCVLSTSSSPQQLLRHWAIESLPQSSRQTVVVARSCVIAVASSSLPSHHHFCVVGYWCGHLCALASLAPVTVPKLAHNRPHIIVVASSLPAVALSLLVVDILLPWLLSHHCTVAIPSSLPCRYYGILIAYGWCQRSCRSHSAYIKVILLLAFLIARWIHLSGPFPWLSVAPQYASTTYIAASCCCHCHSWMV